MNNTPRDPLSNEERELATMLSRLRPYGEPSPALDARILAASRTAVAPRRSKPGWPVALGLAASVVGAIGIAWQLRPVQPAMMASEVPLEESVAPAENAAPAQSDAAPAATADAQAQAEAQAEAGNRNSDAAA
ncbi:MAG TPA: hypothetical protein VEY92_03990, partial [Pseudoxanthomonas sp.]|nr:hypothetical protein [Pseudoxanthomonas sp.]